MTFSYQGINEPGWPEKFAAEMERAFKARARGMKVSKQLGQGARNPDGTFAMGAERPFISTTELDYVTITRASVRDETNAYTARLDFARDIALFRAFEPRPVAAHQGPVVVTVGEDSPPLRHAAARALAAPAGAGEFNNSSANYTPTPTWTAPSGGGGTTTTSWAPPTPGSVHALPASWPFAKRCSQTLRSSR